MLGPFGVFGAFAIIAFIIALAATVFWVWMLIDCLQNPRLTGTDKIVWILVIFFLHFVGALIYYFVGRERPTAGL